MAMPVGRNLFTGDKQPFAQRQQSKDICKRWWYAMHTLKHHRIHASGIIGMQHIVPFVKPYLYRTKQLAMQNFMFMRRAHWQWCQSRQQTVECSERRFILARDVVMINRLGLGIYWSLRSKHGWKGRRVVLRGSKKRWRGLHIQIFICFFFFIGPRQATW